MDALISKKKDIFLIETFEKRYKDEYTPQKINKYRLYLKIFTLSDITSSDGTHILKYPLTGNLSPSFSPTTQ